MASWLQASNCSFGHSSSVIFRMLDPAFSHSPGEWARLNGFELIQSCFPGLALSSFNIVSSGACCLYNSGGICHRSQGTDPSGGWRFLLCSSEPHPSANFKRDNPPHPELIALAKKRFAPENCSALEFAVFQMLRCGNGRAS
jgi:hypothetical protein